MRIRRLCHSIALAVLSAAALTAASAQEIIDLGAIRVCGSCRFELQPLFVMGEASGAGIIESEQVEVVHGAETGMFAVFSPGQSYILLFDSAGTFVRRIGRQGPGPTEITGLVDVQFRGSEIVAMDYGTPKLLVMDSMGNHLHDTRLMVQPGRFRMITDSSLVVGSVEQTPDLVGYPLHAVSLRTGEAYRHFGSRDGEFRAYEPYAEDVVLGWSPDRNRVWRGSRARIDFEEWNVQGEWVRTIRGQLDWFNELEASRRSGPPSSLVTDFASDGNNRLWIAVYVPDPNWREIRPQGSEGFIQMSDMSNYFDTRIDVFDLRHRKHLGSTTLDEAFAGFVQIGDGLAVQRVVYDSEMVPRVALYRVSFSPPPFQRRNR